MVWVFFIFFSLYSNDKVIEAIVDDIGRQKVIRLDQRLIESSKLLTEMYQTLGTTQSFPVDELPRLNFTTSFLRYLTTLCGDFIKDNDDGEFTRSIALNCALKLLDADSKIEVINAANFFNIKYLHEFIDRLVVKNTSYDQVKKIIYNSDLKEYIFDYIPDYDLRIRKKLILTHIDQPLAVEILYMS